jgi:tetratricopeptide (TPR) repeat protein
MTNAPVLLVVAMLNAGEELGEAQRAFSEGRYAEAEALAERAAQPPQRGRALYLVGLARFRAGRPAEALEALDAAGRAEDAPEPTQWNFNRGACLYALGRFEEAERAFAEAGANESLARLAWVNAGFAALDAGAPERAARWAERARPGASEQELAQVRELRAELDLARAPAAHEADSESARALEAFDAGRFDEAHALFLQAAGREPESGRARLMAGASSYRLGRRDRAREELTGALRLRLEPGDTRIAHEYLDRLSFGLRARGPGLWLLADAGGGYDSNVFQVGVASRDVSGETSATQTGSLFVEAGLGAVGRLRLSDTLFAELSYGGSQRVYSLSTARDYSLQLHHVDAKVEWEAARRVRVGVGVGADVFLTGLSSFRGLQASGTATAWAALDESARTSTRLEGAFTPKRGLGSEFDYLSGQRLDAGLSQEVRGGRWALVARYQYRVDLIGTLEQTAATDAAVTSQTYVIPYAWRGHGAGASLGVVPFGAWEARLDAGVEWRRYVGDSVLRVRTTQGREEEWGRRRREDLRGLGGASVGVRLARPLRLSARYDLLVNLSNMDTRLTDATGSCAAPDYVCHRYDYTNGNYQKHQGLLVLDGTW